MISSSSMMVPVRRSRSAWMLVVAGLTGLVFTLAPVRAEPGVPGAPSNNPRDVEAQRKKLQEAGRQAIQMRDQPGRGLKQTELKQGDTVSSDLPVTPPKIDGDQPATPAPAPAPAGQPGQPAQPAPAVVQTDGPKIDWENPSHDWGTVMDNKPLVCSFKFKNVGNQKLVIGNINTGCGCTVANLAKKEFEPGEGAEIDITFTPKGSGKQQRAVSVQTNDPRSPNAQLMIAANVIPLVEARPNNVQFGQVAIGEERTTEIVIVSRDPNMQVTGIEVNGPEIKAELVKRKPAIMVEAELPGVAVIDVKLQKDAPVGRLLRMITVNIKASKTAGDPPGDEQVRVNAFASIQGELTIEPPFVRAHPLVAGEEFQREIVVTRAGGKPFKLEGVEIANANISGVTASFEETKVGNDPGYKITLKGKAGDTANNFRGEVVLHTDLEREKTTQVQFSGLVRVTPPAPQTASAPTGTTPPQQPAQKP